MCVLQVHPENAEWTCFEQSAEVDIKSFLGFESTIEKLAMKQYSANIAKGKEVMEYFIAQLKHEGITTVSRWTRDPTSPDIEDRYVSNLFYGSYYRQKFMLKYYNFLVKVLAANKNPNNHHKGG